MERHIPTMLLASSPNFGFDVGAGPGCAYTPMTELLCNTWANDVFVMWLCCCVTPPDELSIIAAAATRDTTCKHFPLTLPFVSIYTEQVLFALLINSRTCDKEVTTCA